jgi:hypothetical protein
MRFSGRDPGKGKKKQHQVKVRSGQAMSGSYAGHGNSREEAGSQIRGLWEPNVVQSEFGSASCSFGEMRRRVVGGGELLHRASLSVPHQQTRTRR